MLVVDENVILWRCVGTSQGLYAVECRHHVHTLPEVVVLSLLPTAIMSAALTDDLPSSRLHDSCIMRLGEHEPPRNEMGKWSSTNMVQDAVSVLLLYSNGRGTPTRTREQHFPLSNYVRLCLYSHTILYQFSARARWHIRMNDLHLRSTPHES